MGSWTEILAEVRAAGSGFDIVRRTHLERLHKHTGRNAIIYYSGWLQKDGLARQGVGGFDINDADKSGLMAVIHKLDKSKGLDLILHTPGGGMAATESIVDYLRSMFGTDIRAIVPQLAMSAGTMIACSCKEIVMGKHSSLGPIDPQIFGIPAHGVIEEFQRAVREIKADQTRIPVWQPIIAKYNPTMIGECEKAIAWAEEMVAEWTMTGMFKGDPKADEKARKVVSELGDHALTKSHSRHISAEQARAIGLPIVALEDSQELQDAVLSVHHAAIQTLTSTDSIKIIENHLGVAHINAIQTRVVAK